MMKQMRYLFSKSFCCTEYFDQMLMIILIIKSEIKPTSFSSLLPPIITRKLNNFKIHDAELSNANAYSHDYNFTFARMDYLTFFRVKDS